MQINPSQRPIATFLLITFLLSSIFYFLVIYTGKLGGGYGMYVTGLMWCPTIAAIITSKILKRDIALLGWQWGKTKYQIQSYLMPLLYSLIAYLVIWTLGFGKFYNVDTVTEIANEYGLNLSSPVLTLIPFFILTAIFGTIKSCATAAGEEIGWRGFLVPELFKTMGYTKTSLIAGIIWAIWHFPILIFADYNSGTLAWYGLTCFTVMVISLSFILTWYRLKSHSLWTGVIIHASHNLFIQGIFTPLTADTGNTKYYIDEFGIVLPIICLCFAIYFWSRRSEIQPLDNTL